MIKRYFTTAPERYDYDYVATAATGIQDYRGLAWRLVETTDQERFESHQKLRYLSGLYGCVEVGSESAQASKLSEPSELQGSVERLQAVMSGAGRHLKDGMSYPDFLRSLDPTVRAVVVLGNFDRQVCNNGLSCWVSNGFAKSADLLTQTLRRVGTDNAKKALALVHLAVQRAADLENDNDGTVEIALDDTGAGYAEYREALIAEAVTALLGNA